MAVATRITPQTEIQECSVAPASRACEEIEGPEQVVIPRVGGDPYLDEIRSHDHCI